MYKRINKKEGIRCFPFIGTVFVSNDKDLWANPFENRDLRHRCFFKILDEKMEIFFHLTKDEFNKKTEITDFPCKTYFFGAYNQINVCQMRAFGKLDLLNKPAHIKKFRNELKADLEKRTNDTNLSSRNEVKSSEKMKALDIVSKDGVMFFKFIPTSYAYHMYERG